MKKIVSMFLLTTMLFTNGMAFAKSSKEEPVIDEAVIDEAVTRAYVDVESGALMGYKYNGIYTFKGIPYAKAERFMLPTKVESWQGVKVALTYGEVSPAAPIGKNMFEFMTPGGSPQVPNEDCQYLNIWSPSVKKSDKKPVLVFIHGGGFSGDSAHGIPYYDGANLSSSGDLVFVSINHRLNVLGYLDLSAYGEEYKYSGNVGQADLIAALQWVQDNIDQFGGDPSNVTIVGQSGGAAKVLTLLGMPAAKGLFQKAVAESAGVAGKDLETSHAETAKILEALGINDDEVDKLKTISHAELFEAAAATGYHYGPVVDGDYYPAVTVTNGKFSDLSKDIPLLFSTTASEFASNFPGLAVFNMPEGSYKPDITDEVAMKMLEDRYGDSANAIADEFKNAYPYDRLTDLLFMQVRDNSVVLAKADQGGADVYQCVWDWEFPIFGGVKSYHTGGDMPFFFDNLDKVEMFIAGDRKGAEELASKASKSLINFVYTGNPNHDGLSEWPAFTREVGATMIWDSISEARDYHDKELMRLITSASK